MTMREDPSTVAAAMSDPCIDYNVLLDRPIVVGYAFGPKKMSTMGVVMAEASKTKIFTATKHDYVTCEPVEASYLRPDVSPDFEEAEEDDDDDDDEDEGYSRVVSRLEDDPDHRGTNQVPASGTINQWTTSSRIVFSMETGGYGNGRGSSSGSGLANIVRHFQATCSDSESTGTCTASTNTNGTATTMISLLPTVTSSGGSSLTSLQQHGQQPGPLIRVSFVPLDPDQPLQDQHGGKIDIILHKLTEDILCLSQLSLTRNGDTTTLLSPAELAAIRRVERLIEFRKEQPHCCLVDDPDRVQIVMSRSDIASKLQECLQNVTTTSGMAVSSPRYSVVTRPDCDDGNDDEAAATNEAVAQQLAHLSYPIIVKPLIAAGTKASHAMAVLMDPSGLDKVALKAPCLCQEFSNHDTVLYKVYVLGDYVSVHKRRSLPNLPRNGTSRFDFVEFDSHRPYPRLSDFGFDESDDNDLSNNMKKRPRQPSSTCSAASPVAVTADEVMPIVDALKQAFGLELFGFDVLIVSDPKTMLVVDVNYFPSYKEVQNFPSLLAKYLTDRVIQSRRRAMEAANEAALHDDE